MAEIRSYSNTVECSVRVPTPSARYLDEFFSIKCAGDLAPFFPNAKEVTESFACFNAVRKVLGPASFANTWTCVVPGDGTAPRTAALFALRTRWNVISVDPLMKNRHVVGRHGLRRLSARKITTDEMCAIEAGGRAIVVACHSHAKLSGVLDKVKADRVDVFSLPCCVHDDIQPTTRSWVDAACWSPRNRINVYLDVMNTAGA